MSHIKIRGAKVHNLKNIDLDLPKNQLVVFTGVSGSGKSSLAFDTLYAEGQRRYVESLSSYARQFLGVLSKPDVESIEGLSPAISIDQKSTQHNPRSTVGTITEIADYFRLLFARVGEPFCVECGTKIAKLTSDEITDKILALLKNEIKKSPATPIQFEVVAPVVRDRKGEYASLLASLRSSGYEWCYIDGKRISTQEDIVLIKTNKHNIEAVIDTLSPSSNQMKETEFVQSLRRRIFQSVEQSLTLTGGLVILRHNESQTLFSSNFSCPACGHSLPEIEPRMFSFNSPQGACEACHGLGIVNNFDERLILNKNLSITEGAILPLFRLGISDTWFGRLFTTVLEDINIEAKSPLTLASESSIRSLLYGNKKTYRVSGKNRHGENTSIFEIWEGIIPILKKKYEESESDWVKSELEKFQNSEICASCSGKRLKKEVLAITLLGQSIYDMGELAIIELYEKIDEIYASLTDFQKQIAQLIIKEIKARSKFLVDVGLSYLTLNRGANTLSGGEAQRIRLASQIGSGLTGVMYILDEPSIGLHPKDVHALVQSLRSLVELGNSVFVVEHDPETIENAQYIVDFGPKAGIHGGEVQFAGTYEELKGAKTLTSKYLFHENIPQNLQKVQKNPPKSGFLTIHDVKTNNLKSITAKFPLGALTCVTGVSGSGKSSLLIDTLYPALKYQLQGTHSPSMGEFRMLDGFHYVDSVHLVDQSAIGRTPRSNPATYLGIFDFIRDIFASTPDAKGKGYQKGRFSFNVKGGRCEKCTGGGVIKIEMQFLPDIYIACDVCSGKRYNFETLEVKYKDKSIYDVLEMTIEEAQSFFATHSMISRKLKILSEIGLGYIKLGQTAPTLSGGEAQRIKIANELAKKDSGRTVYILDEPTTGLHLYDVEKLLIALRELVNRGNTVLMVEHNLDVIASCDFLLDLGPTGGKAGGEIIAQGSVLEVANNPDSATGKFLLPYLQSKGILL